MAPKSRDIKLKNDKRLDDKQDVTQTIRATISDEEGLDTGDLSIWADQNRRRLWVKELATAAPSIVPCYKITPTPADKGLGVQLGYPIGSQIRQVLDADDDFLGQTNPDGRSYSAPQAADFRPGGRLQLWVAPKLIEPLATFPGVGLSVNVTSGYYPYAGGRVLFAGSANFALTQNPNPGEHYYAGLYLDSANALQVVYGASVSTAFTPPIPTFPAGAFELSLVRVNDTQTVITLAEDTSTTNDIIDRRMLFSDENSAGGGWPFDLVLSISPTSPAANYPTIQDGFDNATSGDVLLADPATYTEEVITSNNASLIGWTENDIGSPIITTANNDSVTFEISADNTSYEKFTVVNSGGGTDSICVQMDAGSNNIRLANLTIDKSTGAPTNSYGLNFPGALTGAVVDDCDIAVTAGTNRYGIRIVEAAEVSIIGGSINGTTGAILVNHAGALVSLQGPKLLGGGLTVTAGTVKGWYVDSNGNIWYSIGGNTFTPLKSAPTNILYHSMHHDDWQEGVTFNDIADATTYAGTLWLAVQNGQAPDVSGLAGGSTSDYKRACRTTFDSAASQNGFVQFLTNEDTVGLRGKSVSVSAEIWGASVANIALNVLIWTSTADTMTKDVVATWNNGSVHTLATNWAFGVTSVAIPVGASEGTRYATNNIPIPTNANNIAVFISTWDNEASTDVWTFANVQLEVGTVATAFVPWQLLSVELPRVNQFYWKTFDITTTPAQGTTTVGTMRTQAITAGATAIRAPQITFPVRMRTTPTVTFFSTVSANAEARDATAGADCSATGAGATARWGFGINCTGNAATAVGNVIQVQAVADARF